MTDDTLTAAVARLRDRWEFAAGCECSLCRDIHTVQRKMRDSDRPMTQREAYQRGYAAGYAAAQSGPPREPTQAMLDAGTLVYIREQQKRIPKWEPVIAARFWRAMHDAWAQEQPAATPSTGRPDAGAAQAVTDGPAADQRLARENAKWNELHRTIAEELGYSAETWPDHRNAPLAIAAAFVLSKQRVERAEAERAALRELLRKVLHATSANMSMDMYAEVCAAIDAERAKVPK